jgi:ATP-binding cassette subfamily F protein 3
MARLMLTSYNLLALDEPTNHMDIRSKDVLKTALKAFDGTLIVVSHDRDFLDGLVSKVYEFGDGKVREHLGGINDFLANKKISSMREIEALKATEAKEQKQPVVSKSQQDRAADKAAMRERSRKQNLAKKLEGQIEQIEQKMKEIEAKLSAPTPEDDIMDLTREYLEQKRELDIKMDQWSQIEL